MRKLKRTAWNSACSTGLWVLYNTFFLALHAWYAYSPYYWNFSDPFVYAGETIPILYDTIVPAIFLLLYLLTFIGFSLAGKKILVTTESHILNLVSIILGCIVILCCLWYAYNSEYTILVLTNFLIICVAEVVNSEKLAEMCYLWFANVCVVILPYVCMYVGLIFQKPKRQKENSERFRATSSELPKNPQEY